MKSTFCRGEGVFRSWRTPCPMLRFLVWNLRMVIGLENRQEAERGQTKAVNGQVYNVSSEDGRSACELYS